MTKIGKRRKNIFISKWSKIFLYSTQNINIILLLNINYETYKSV